MTTYETINAMKNTLTAETITSEEYFEKESELINLVNSSVIGAKVECTTHGFGKVTKTEGDTLDSIIVDITFEEGTKTFSLGHIFTNAKFIKFEDELLANLWTEAFEVHTTLTNRFKESKRIAEAARLAEEKKIEDEKKAEVKYNKLKAKAIKDFDNLTQQPKAPLSTINEFYYALGWLVKHIGTMTAQMPDYLVTAFKKHFGEDTECTAIDSKKRTSGGYSMKWTFGFKATLRKAENIPAELTPYLNSTGKAIANTSFIFDLVDNYGFQFGKKQNVNKIKEAIPAKYIDSFNMGFAA